MDDDTFNWLNRFSGGKMPARKGVKADAESDLREAYRIARTQEEISERAFKDNMLDSAFQALADKKELIRDAFNFEVEVSGRKVKTLAPQKEAFDTEQTSKVTDAPKGDIVRDAYAMKELLVAQKDNSLPSS